MLKMFSTQLTGLFKRISEKEEFAFEDAARLLAQAAVSESVIYLYGTNEMEAVVSEATVGSEPMKFAKRFQEDMDALQDSDRAILLSRYSNDLEAIEMAKKLLEKGIPFVAIATKIDSEGEEDLFSLADVALNLQLSKGLLPDELGNRFGLPTSMAALFVYYGIKFTFDEILAEYDEE